MKLPYSVIIKVAGVSRPARGGWIEIVFNLPSQNLRPSRPARGGWIEITIARPVRSGRSSRPARGGWIEI